MSRACEPPAWQIENTSDSFSSLKTSEEEAGVVEDTARHEKEGNSH
jgi:hypothetical protein